MKFIVTNPTTGNWTWRWEKANGDLLAIAPTSYPNEPAARSAILAVKTAARGSRFVKVEVQ